MRNFIILFAIFLVFQNMDLLSNNKQAEQLLEVARLSYYKSTENEKHLEPSIKLFEDIKKRFPNYAGVSQTYIGSLTLLKGKYAFWPQKKLQYVEEGLAQMDEGLKLSPNNIESLFIYGTTCYYLPFFLGKKGLAIEKLNSIIPLLSNSTVKSYDKEIMKNVLAFLLENLELSTVEEQKIKSVKNTL